MTLTHIAWSFTDKYYTSLEKFNKDVTQYQKDLNKEDDCWQPDEIVFDFPQLQIQYMAWISKAEDLLDNETLIEDDQNIFEEEADEDEHQVEIIARFKADNGINFSALEFLMKTHNQQANKELGDHVCFEGTDENPEAINGLPTCYIVCGS